MSLSRCSKTSTRVPWAFGTFSVVIMIYTARDGQRREHLPNSIYKSSGHLIKSSDGVREGREAEGEYLLHVRYFYAYKSFEARTSICRCFKATGIRQAEITVL